MLNYREFRKNLPKYLNKVNKNEKVVIVRRSTVQNVVIISMREYNAINET